MGLQRVIVVGGNGTLGPFILDALKNAGQFDITVLSRASSKSTYSLPVHDARMSNDMKHDELVSSFQGQDVLIVCMITDPEVSLRLADAAFEAGIQRVIPADFGSCDSSDERSLNVVKLYRNKKKVRDHLIQLSEKKPDGSFSWTSLITGHFLDQGLPTGLMSLDVKKRTARIYDGGDIPFSATTLSSIGLATAKVLQHEAVTKNKLIYVQSVSTTQNELLSVVEKVTGDQFSVEHVDSNAFIKEHKAKLEEKHGNDPELQEELVSVEGIVNANWVNRTGFANQELGMPEESLEAIVRKALA